MPTEENGKASVTGKAASQVKKDWKTVTRRDFLKYTGTIVLVMGSGCYAPVNRQSKELKAPVTSRSGIPASDGYLLVDIRKCQGCASCMLVSDENFDGDDKARKCDLCANTPFHWDAAGGGPDGKQACVEVCPVGAIRFTREIPVQEGDEGYKVNLRGRTWEKLGYPTG